MNTITSGFIRQCVVAFAMLAALTPASGIGAGLVGMLVWATLGFIATVVVVARRRSAGAKVLLAASPALA